MENKLFADTEKQKKNIPIANNEIRYNGYIEDIETQEDVDWLNTQLNKTNSFYAIGDKTNNGYICVFNESRPDETSLEVITNFKMK